MSRIVLSVIALGALGLSPVPAGAASSGGPVASPPIIIVGPIPGPVGPTRPIHPRPVWPTPAPGPINPGGPIKPAPITPIGPIVSPFSGI